MSVAMERAYILLQVAKDGSQHGVSLSNLVSLAVAELKFMEEEAVKELAGRAKERADEEAKTKADADAKVKFEEEKAAREQKQATADQSKTILSDPNPTLADRRT